MIVYISGPMISMPEHNHPLFNRIARIWRHAGHDVMNPAEINPPEALYTREECLRRDVRCLSECEIITFLPGWQQSKGALLERQIAFAIGCVVHWDYENPPKQIYLHNYLHNKEDEQARIRHGNFRRTVPLRKDWFHCVKT